METAVAVSVPDPPPAKVATTFAFVCIAAAFASYVAAGAPTPLLVVFEREWGFAAWNSTIAFAVYAFAFTGRAVGSGLVF
jgi:hypothetical protein